MLVGDDVKEKKPDPSIYLTAAKVVISELYHVHLTIGLPILIFLVFQSLLSVCGSDSKILYMAETRRVRERLLGGRG